MRYTILAVATFYASSLICPSQSLADSTTPPLSTATEVLASSNGHKGMTIAGGQVCEGVTDCDLFEFLIVAEVGDQGITAIEPDVSVNNGGRTTFVGIIIDGGTGEPVPHIFAEGPTGQLVDVTPGIGSTLDPILGPGVQINDAGLIAVRRAEFISSPLGDIPVSYIEHWDSAAPGNQTTLIYCEPLLGEFDGCLAYPSSSNAGSTVFMVIEGSQNRLGTLTPQGNFIVDLNAELPRPMMADNHRFAIRLGTLRVVVLPPAIFPFEYDTGGAFSAVSRMPGFSDDGALIAFAGTGAGGTGLYLSEKISSTSYSVPIALASTNVDFTSFDFESRVGVARSSDPDQAYCAFLGTDLAGIPGLYFSRINGLASGNPSVEHSVVVSVGGTIPGLPGTVESLQLYDPINENGEIGFWVQTTQTTAVVRTCPCGDCGGGALAGSFDISIDRIEFTQATQNDLSNPANEKVVGTIPLVAGKPVLVRVFATWTGQKPAGVSGWTASMTIDGQTSKLEGGTPRGTPGPLPVAPNPDFYEDTFNFTTVFALGDTSILEFEVNPCASTAARVPESDFSNNAVTVNAADLNIVCREAADIRYIPVNYFGTLPDPAKIAGGDADRLYWQVLPAPYAPLRYKRAPFALVRDNDLSGYFSQRLLVVQLSRLAKLAGGGQSEPLVVGFVPGVQASGVSTTGLASYFFGASWVDAADDTPPPTSLIGRHVILAHELGHVYGLNHNSTMTGHAGANVYGIPIPCFEAPDNRIIKRSDLGQLMFDGLGGNCLHWIGPEDYQQWLESDLLDCNTTAMPGATESLLVTGWYSERLDDAVLEPAWRQAGLTQGPFEPSSDIRLKGFVGNELAFDLGVAPPDFSDAGGAGSADIPFLAVVPARGGMEDELIDVLRVVRASDGLVLHELARSRNVPEASITSPRPGAMLFDGATVSWAGNDPDGDALFYSLYYSPDSGASMFPLALDSLANALVLDTAELPGSAAGAALLRLIVTDGMNTAEVITRNLTLDQNQQPKLLVFSPVDGDAFIRGGSMLTYAAATDAEDGELRDESIVWSSDLDGPIGTGGTPDLSSLSLGLHEITITAGDSSGATDSATTTVLVYDPACAAGELIDCNGNGINDACDIAVGAADDLNGDGVIDACLCPGDLTQDGIVGFGDLLAVLAAWGAGEGPEDIDGSGSVDFADLLIVLAAWGPCV